MEFKKEKKAVPRTGKIRVLVVEDTRAIRSHLLGLTVECEDLELVGDAISGKRAINLIERLEPDVVLLGLVLEGMDGLTALQKIHDKFPQTPVIVITSDATRDQVAAALAAGAAGHVDEPFSTEEMVRIIYAVHTHRRRPAASANRFYHRSGV